MKIRRIVALATIPLASAGGSYANPTNVNLGLLQMGAWDISSTAVADPGAVDAYDQIYTFSLNGAGGISAVILPSWPTTINSVTTVGDWGSFNSGTRTLTSYADLTVGQSYSFEVIGTDSVHDSYGGYNLNIYGAPVAAVPEPENYAMLLAGLGLMGVVVRRRATVKSA